MPFAMIPEGFKLQKVTKAQEKAVKDKRRHDDMVALLNNPTAATAIIAPIVAIATGAAGVALVDLIVGLLKKEGATITEKAVEQTKQSVKGVVGAVQTTASVAQEIAETGSRSVVTSQTSAIQNRCGASRSRPFNPSYTCIPIR